MFELLNELNNEIFQRSANLDEEEETFKKEKENLAKLVSERDEINRVLEYKKYRLMCKLFVKIVNLFPEHEYQKVTEIINGNNFERNRECSDEEFINVGYCKRCTLLQLHEDFETKLAELVL